MDGPLLWIIEKVRYRVKLNLYLYMTKNQIQLEIFKLQKYKKFVLHYAKFYFLSKTDFLNVSQLNPIFYKIVLSLFFDWSNIFSRKICLHT